jgi:hypothetical protein
MNTQNTVEQKTIPVYHKYRMSRERELQSMVACARKRWPAIAYKKGGSRADKAAEIVQDGQLLYLGETSLGDDHWDVDGHQVMGEYCDCEDRYAPVAPGHGRLCKHRLAVMFQQRLDARSLDAIEAILRQAGGDEIVLEVQTYYRGDLHLQTSNLVGYRLAGQKWVRFGPDETISFRVRDLEKIMYAHGWRIAPGQRLVVGRHYGGRERWFLEPLPAGDQVFDSNIATATESLYGRDVATADDQARERRLREMFNEGMGWVSV